MNLAAHRITVMQYVLFLPYGPPQCGRRWNTEIYPLLRDFVHVNS